MKKEKYLIGIILGELVTLIVPPIITGDSTILLTYYLVWGMITFILNISMILVYRKALKLKYILSLLCIPFIPLAVFIIMVLNMKC